ncbi:Imm1 family immunity protein [Streptomyces sp. NPDC005047]
MGGKGPGASLNVDLQIVKNLHRDEIDNVMSVGIDYDSGYGAIIWYCAGEVAEQVTSASGPEMAEHAWVSWNPLPPEKDPAVLSDPGCPSYFAHASAIPLDDVRSAVEEYYQAGTGFRPSSVNWVKGNLNGELYEEVSDL